MPDGAERRQAQRRTVRAMGKSDFIELDDYLRGGPKRATQTDLLVGDDDDEGALFSRCGVYFHRSSMRAMGEL